jgi:hypothetical protein
MQIPIPSSSRKESLGRSRSGIFAASGLGSELASFQDHLPCHRVRDFQNTSSRLCLIRLVRGWGLQSRED